MSETVTEKSPHDDVNIEINDSNIDISDNKSGNQQQVNKNIDQQLANSFYNNKIPSPVDFLTYSEFESDVKQWYMENSSRIEGIPQNPISFTYYRPPTKSELVKPTIASRLIDVRADNSIWFQDMLINSSEIDPTAQLPHKIKNKNLPVSQIFEDKSYLAEFTPQNPNPNMFSDYKSYTEASIKWRDSLSEKYPKNNNIEIIMRKFPKYEDNMKYKYTPNIEKPKNGLDPRFYNIPKNKDEIKIGQILSDLYLTTKMNKSCKYGITPQGIAIFDQYKVTNPSIAKLKVEKVLDSLTEPASPALFAPLNENIYYIRNILSSIENQYSYIDDPNKQLTQTDFICALGLIHKNTSFLYFAKLLDTFKSMFNSKNYGSLMTLLQNTHNLIMLGYIITVITQKSFVSYLDYVMDTWPFEISDQILKHAVHVLIQKNVTNLILNYFISIKASNEQLSLAKDMHKAANSQVEILFQSFKPNLSKFMASDLSTKGIRMTVSVLNLLLDCNSDLVYEFLISIPGFFRLLNNISMQSPNDFMKIVLPFYKIKENTILLQRIFVNYIPFAPLDEFDCYSTLMLGMISVLFSMNPTTYIFPDYDWISTLFTHLIQSNCEHSSYTLYTISTYLYTLASNPKSKIDPSVVFNSISFVAAGLQAQVLSPYYMRAFGKLLILPQSQDFIVSSDQWFLTLIRHTDSPNYDTQRYAWRTFHAFVDGHMNHLPILFKSKQVQSSFAAALNSCTTTGLMEIFWMFTCIFEKNLKSQQQISKQGQATSVFFGIQNIHPDLIFFCDIFIDNGFKLEEYISKLLSGAGPEHNAAKTVLARFKRVFSERRYMRGLLERETNVALSSSPRQI